MQPRVALAPLWRVASGPCIDRHRLAASRLPRSMPPAAGCVNALHQVLACLNIANASVHSLASCNKDPLQTMAQQTAPEAHTAARWRSLPGRVRLGKPSAAPGGVSGARARARRPWAWESNRAGAWAGRWAAAALRGTGAAATRCPRPPCTHSPSPCVGTRASAGAPLRACRGRRTHLLPGQFSATPSAGVPCSHARAAARFPVKSTNSGHALPPRCQERFLILRRRGCACLARAKVPERDSAGQVRVVREPGSRADSPSTVCGRQSSRAKRACGTCEVATLNRAGQSPMPTNRRPARGPARRRPAPGGARTGTGRPGRRAPRAERREGARTARRPARRPPTPAPR